MSKKYDIFISHAVNDKPVVDALLDFLKTAGSIPHSKIYCTSKPDLQITSGAFFKKEIFDALNDSQSFFAIMSENYAASFNCALELGASINVLDQNRFFLVIPPYSFENVPTFLKGVQMNGSITDKRVLMDLRDHLRFCLSPDEAKTALWNEKVDQLLKQLNTIIPILPGPPNVSKQKFDELLKQKNVVDSQLTEANNQISTLLAENEALKRAKDSKEVHAITQKFSDLKSNFEDLVKEANDELEKVSLLVQNIIYYQLYSGSEVLAPEKYEYDDVAWREASERGFVDETCTLNTGHRVISRIKNKIDELKYFLNKHEEEKFIQDLCDKIGCEPYLSDKVFWDYLF